MRIELDDTTTDNLICVANIKPGECFYVNGKVYMIIYSLSMQGVRCVSIATGIEEKFNSDTLIYRVEGVFTGRVIK